MKKEKSIKGFKVILVLVNLVALAGCASVEGRFANARNLYRRGQKDASFFELRRIARNDAKPLLTWKAQFGMGEYYFECRAMQDAEKCFIAYLADKNFSSSKDVSLALAKLYLYKISHPGSESLPEEIAQEFFKEPLFLLFSEYKYQKYTSPLGHKYEVREYPQRVEVYIDGKPFQTLTP
jgi:hypothetical protein